MRCSLYIAVSQRMRFVQVMGAIIVILFLACQGLEAHRSYRTCVFNCIPRYVRDGRLFSITPRPLCLRASSPEQEVHETSRSKDE
ncbi:hypothetical protein F4780DRAFT_240472 [Xylariomycetidae sp. FL0641]|nr:hypothetical protein F4780DRAFT_240472 [Xylariomycetidae sp. FL0641]